MAYTDIDKPSDYFNTVLYTGNGSTQSITGVGFQPDWVWMKQRNAAQSHVLIDSVRGVLKRLRSDQSDAEDTKANSLTAFGTDGFTLGSAYEVNDSSDTYVAWNWKAGTSFTNDASGTGIGSIDSAGSASDTSGFSIVSYSGTGSAGTIKHGLSTAPSMIIVKVRTGRTSDWLVYHKGVASDAQTDFLKLNETNAVADEATIWNDTAPTSSVFSVGTEDTVSGSGNTFIAYCFADVQGYSKFGSYTGNGNVDGPFFYTGFKPAFVMIKASSRTGDWVMYDNKRSVFNIVTKRLNANLNSAEDTDNFLDFCSNGIKIRNTYGSHNTSGETYIYMAFAENPFVTSTAIPATAR